MHRLQPFQNGHIGSKIKIPQNMRKTTLEEQYSCSIWKTAEKTAKIRKIRPFRKLPITATRKKPFHAKTAPKNS